MCKSFWSIPGTNQKRYPRGRASLGLSALDNVSWIRDTWGIVSPLRTKPMGDRDPLPSCLSLLFPIRQDAFYGRGSHIQMWLLLGGQLQICLDMVATGVDFKRGAWTLHPQIASHEADIQWITPWPKDLNWQAMALLSLMNKSQLIFSDSVSSPAGILMFMSSPGERGNTEDPVLRIVFLPVWLVTALQLGWFIHTVFYLTFWNWRAPPKEPSPQ